MEYATLKNRKIMFTTIIFLWVSVWNVIAMTALYGYTFFFVVNPLAKTIVELLGEMVFPAAALLIDLVLIRDSWRFRKDRGGGQLLLLTVGGVALHILYFCFVNDWIL